MLERPVRAHFVFLFFLIEGMTLTRAAWSQDDERHRLKLRFQASASCPSSEVFLDEVNGLTQSVKWDLEAPDAHELRVTLAPDESTGSLVLFEDGEEVLRREVSESDCTVMVRGLAFVLAVVLDPSVSAKEATTGDNATPVQEATTEAELTEEPASPSPDQRELLPRPVVNTPPSPTRSVTRTDIQPPRRNEPPWFHDRLVILGGTLESGLNTTGALGATASVEVRFLRASSRPPSFAPSLRLGGQFAASPSSERGVGLDVLRYGGFLQACPTWMSLISGFEPLRACPVSSARCEPVVEAWIGRLQHRASGAPRGRWHGWRCRSGSFTWE